MDRAVIGPVSWRGGSVVAIAGLLAGAGAVYAAGTPLGGLLWAVAFSVACAGYGFAAAWALGDAPSLGSAVVSGLAVVLVASTVLGHAGVLGRGAAIAIVALGVGACVLPLPRHDGRVPGALWIAALAAAVLVLVEMASATPWLADALDHPMAVKRLWDTGALAAPPHQAGGQIVGEAYAALFSGAATAGAFDTGLCCGLVLVLLATELAGRPERAGLALFVLLAVPIALDPQPTVVERARWLGTLLHVAMFFGLERAMARRTSGGVVLLLAVALVTVRHELAILAFPYAAAGVLLARGRPPSRRAVVIAAIAWLALLVAVRGSVVALGPGLAITALGLAGSAVVLPALSSASATSPLGVMWFATIAAGLAAPLGVVPAAAHSASANSVIWLGAVIALLSHVDEPASASRRIRLVPAAALAAGVLAFTMLWPNMTTETRRHRIVGHFVEALDALALGPLRPEEQAARGLQQLVPAGARIGFWGRWAGGLDYARNSIVDLSFHGRRFLSGPSEAALARLDYVIVETIEDPTRRRDRPDPWGSARESRSPFASLPPIATSHGTTLYRLAR